MSSNNNKVNYKSGKIMLFSTVLSFILIVFELIFVNYMFKCNFINKIFYYLLFI